MLKNPAKSQKNTLDRGQMRLPAACCDPAAVAVPHNSAAVAVPHNSAAVAVPYNLAAVAVLLRLPAARGLRLRLNCRCLACDRS